MLKYAAPTGLPILKTSHTNECDDWNYSLVNGQLHYYINENFGPQEYLILDCPSQPLALSQSHQGLLLLTTQGYYYFSHGLWVPTTQATVGQFFNTRGRTLYELPANPMSEDVAIDFYHPPSATAVDRKRIVRPEY